jgi:hypothetical protein
MGTEVKTFDADPNEAIEAIFTFHPPTEDQVADYSAIRSWAKSLAYMIDLKCPAGPSRTTAINKLREAVMWANASIATKNAQYR